MPPQPKLSLDHFLFREPAGALDRYQALLDEDQALRHAEYDHPDPKRRRLRVSCNECQTPWCCNQRVTVELVEALTIFRWAARHAPRYLHAAIRSGESLHAGPPLDDHDFFRRRVTCPFLERGRCTIFPVRPYRCRSHYMAGNPMKCRRELAPTDTYEMSPDSGILGELATIAEDVRFQNFVEEVEPTELSETLYFIHRLGGKERWTAPRSLDWSMLAE